VELRSGLVAVDGRVVTGPELRERLGSDAGLILSLSYLDPDALRAFANPGAAPLAVSPEPPKPSEPEPAYARRRTARVRIGSDLVVDENELVEDAAVAILGSVVVNGSVNGDVVAVGGDVRLGPRASVRGSVTAVGGTVVADPAARMSGESHEVAVRLPEIRAHIPPLPHWAVRIRPDDGWLAGLAFTWTAARMTIVGLVALLFTLLARGRIATLRDTIVDAPVAAGFVGLAGELLLAPALIAVAFALLVSLIGIPLLALMPLLILAIALVWVAGFAAVTQVIGSWIPGLRGRPVPSLIAGLAIVWVCPFVARALWWSGAAGWAGPAALGTVGLVIEFLAWTMAFGAVVLGWIGRRAVRKSEAPPAIPVVPSAPVGF
jgi:hypothetical protein